MSLAREVADILSGNYEKLRFHPFFTLWGICYHWDPEQNAFSGQPVKTRYQGLIPQLFRELEDQKTSLRRTTCYVPRARDVAAHYCLRSFQNTDHLARRMAEITERTDIEEIINDYRLLREAATTYLALRADEARDTMDFFDFLTGQNAESPPHSTQGNFRPLLERLLVRFEGSRDLLQEIGALLAPETYAALRDAHREALAAQQPPVSDALRDAHAKYVKKQPLNVNLTPSTKISLRRIFGKRRVKIGYGSNGSLLDLEAYVERLHSRGAVNLNPSRVLQQQLVNMILDSILPKYRKNPRGTTKNLEEQRAATVNPAEAAALQQVEDLLRRIALFEESTLINHTMMITGKGEKT